MVITSAIARGSRPRGTGRGGVRLRNVKLPHLRQTGGTHAGGAHVIMPDYAEMLASAYQSMLLE